MRCYEIFAAMPREQGLAILSEVREKAPAGFRQALLVACGVMKTRPVYLTRQPFERQADAVRRALGRVASNGVAEEILAIYFLECRKPLLVEWLDGVGVAHEEGVLKDDRPPAPDDAKLREFAMHFLSGDAPETRRLLLEAFSAQDTVEWPALDALLTESPRAAS